MSVGVSVTILRALQVVIFLIQGFYLIKLEAQTTRIGIVVASRHHLEALLVDKLFLRAKISAR